MPVSTLRTPYVQVSLPTQYNNKNQDPVGALSSALARLQANRPLRELREIAKVSGGRWCWSRDIGALQGNLMLQDGGRRETLLEILNPHQMPERLFS